MHAFLKGTKSFEQNEGQTSASVVEGTSKEPKERHIPWVEKYRPKTVEDVVEQAEVVEVLRESLSGADLPNLLLYGPPGTGKTSTILAAARQLFGDIFKDRVLELNASDDRGINVIRTKVKNFAQLTASNIRPDGKPCPSFKIIILDESDAMTHAAQSALRRTMETQSKTTRFCLICNYITKIIDPITSRCTKFRFKPLRSEMIIERLQEIAKNENVKANEETLKAIVKVSGGDLRRAITTLQSCYRLNGSGIPVTVSDVLEISGIVPEQFLNEFISICKTNNFKKYEDFVKQFMYNAYSIGQFFDQLNELIIFHDGLTDKQKAIICDKLGESCFKLHNGGSEYVQLMDFGFTVIVALRS